MTSFASRWTNDPRSRKIRKMLPGGASPDRDAQFSKIGDLIEQYESAGDPYFSVDTKAKEFWASSFGKGGYAVVKAFKAFDHDFPTWADAYSPHGIFDLVRNRGHINIGLSHDTTLFACDSLKWYWNRIGQFCYPNADSILLLLTAAAVTRLISTSSSRSSGGRERDRHRNSRGSLPQLLFQVQPH